MIITACFVPQLESESCKGYAEPSTKTQNDLRDTKTDREKPFINGKRSRLNGYLFIGIIGIIFFFFLIYTIK